MLTSPVPAAGAANTWYDLVRYMQAPNRLGDVGEARWPQSHRWTDTSPTLPDAADAERSNRRVTCLLHIISDGTRVRHAQGITLSILRAFIACAAAVQTAVLVVFGPSCLFGALQAVAEAFCLGMLGAL